MQMAMALGGNLLQVQTPLTVGCVTQWAQAAQVIQSYGTSLSAYGLHFWQALTLSGPLV